MPADFASVRASIQTRTSFVSAQGSSFSLAVAEEVTGKPSPQPWLAWWVPGAGGGGQWETTQHRNHAYVVTNSTKYVS